jgi:hypothetical protein
MDSTLGLHAFPRTLRAFAGVILLAGLAACGGIGDRPGATNTEAPTVPQWSFTDTITSCEDFASFAVGSYIMQSNYWNKATCPGTQCMKVNTATGAFSVIRGAEPCGDEVSSYPNVLYGCSYGNCSPATMLPLPVTEVRSLTSSWDWAIGGPASDHYNVAYDIWFCPDNNCGASGFPKGLELMIWLDYKNVHGWRTNLGTKKLSGHTWDVWTADMAAGGATQSWTYLTYMIKSPQVSSVTDLDLGAFIQDGIARGYIKPSWYMYAVQAGVELRVGGIPYNHNSFSVTLNGVTPSSAPIPYTGPSCDGGVPTEQGQLNINDTYVTAGPLHGYGSSWTWVGPDSEAIACGSPTCTGVLTGGPTSCSPAFSPSALCTAGTVTADPTYHSVAGVGLTFNEDPATAAVDVDGGAVAAPLGTITIPNSITVTVARSGGNLTGNNSLRVQLTDVDGNLFCYGGPLNEPIPVGKLNTKCWNNTGDPATPSTRFARGDVIVPSSAATDLSYSYCITNITVQ